MTCQYCSKEYGYYTSEHEEHCSKKPIQKIVYLDYNNLTRMKYAFDTKNKNTVYTLDEVMKALKKWFDIYGIQITLEKINPLQKKQERKVQEIINKRLEENFK